MRNKISITGDLGSGKSAVGRLICEKLQFEPISTGKIQRRIAERLGMSTLELNKYADTHPEIDEEIDSIFKAMNDSPNAYFLDSRLAWHFVPASFKVFLQVKVEVAAARILNDSSRKSEEYQSLEDAIQQLMARKQSENQRFLQTYQVNCADLENFDLVINTTYVSPEKVANLILEQFQRFQNQQIVHKFWASPRLMAEKEPVPALETAHGFAQPITKEIAENELLPVSHL